MKHVKSMVALYKTKKFGNPFKEEGKDLISLHSKDIAGPEVRDTVLNVHNIGEEQYKVFVTGCFQTGTRNIYDTIAKNNLPLFRNKATRTSIGNKVSELKSDCNLFAFLFISCQSRSGDMTEFFSHENQSFPSSLSQSGNLRSTNKSDILQCLSSLITASSVAYDNQLVTTAIAFDGSVLVHFIKPTNGTFADYVRNTFIHYLVKQLEKVVRIDCF